MLTTQQAQLFDKETRNRNFGLSCNDRLNWTGWDVGGDYQKVLVVTNVTTEVLHFKYTLPTNKSFFMDYPEEITLSPGMTHGVKINFRPIALQQCDDFIGFEIGGQYCFSIPVRASLAELKVEMAGEVHFGFCPVNETSSKQFVVQNSGDIPAYFSW